jgi:hypothetical protein
MQQFADFLGRERRCRHRLSPFAGTSGAPS